MKPLNRSIIERRLQAYGRSDLFDSVMKKASICPNCKGKGWTWVSYKGDDMIKDLCNVCNGSGQSELTELKEVNEFCRACGCSITKDEDDNYEGLCHECKIEADFEQNEWDIAERERDTEINSW